MIARTAFAFLILALAPQATSATPADKGQGIDKPWKICAQAVQAAERREGIPQHLLKAISQAESGRWSAEKQANIAWPWTVTSGGKGRFFDTEAEARAEVEILLTQGVRNIDVGCMQVNLMYHPEAFANLAEAFNPDANARYGAKYLRAMYDKTGNWREAAAHYHSTTPQAAARYRTKVVRLWNAARQIKPEPQPVPVVETAQANATSTDDAEPGRTRPALVDYALMDRLNDSFRDRKSGNTGEELADRAAFQAHQRREQLNAWREQQVGGISLVHLANMRRAELAQRSLRQRNRVSAEDRADAFAERRQSQLAAWRARNSDPHFNAYPTEGAGN
jgi:hypothetical protein